LARWLRKRFYGWLTGSDGFEKLLVVSGKIHALSVQNARPDLKTWLEIKHYCTADYRKPSWRSGMIARRIIENST
jgi:hypothetical protein